MSPTDHATDNPATDHAPAGALDRLRRDLIAQARSGTRVAVDATDARGHSMLLVGFIASVTETRAVIERAGGCWSTLLLDRITRVAPVQKGR